MNSLTESRAFVPQVVLLEDRLAPALFSTMFTTEHVDVELDYFFGSWTQRFRNADTNVPTPTQSTIAFLGANAKATAPSGPTFSFLGAGNKGTVYILPQAQNTDLVYLGISGETIAPGTFPSYRPNDPRVTNSAPWLRMDLVEVRGPGNFSLYQTNQAGQPIVWAATSDGITAKDAAYIPVGGHVHYNWAFTERGIYEVDIRTTAFLGANQTSPTVSPVNTLFFSVDPPGPTNSVPSKSFTSTGGSSIVFSSNSNAITISGPTTAPAPIEVTISSGKGNLSLGTTANIGLISGNNSSKVTIVGTYTQVNQALNGLTYRPVPGFNGVDEITIRSSDRGEYRPAPNNEQIATDAIGILVAGNPDAPPPVEPGPGQPGGGISPPVVPPAPTFPPGSSQAMPRRMALAAPAGVPSSVTVVDTETKNNVFTFAPYGAFTGGTRVAVADFNGDGIPDIVTAAGPGGGPHVQLFDGATFQPIRSFFAYSSDFTGGVSIAVADINNDGVPDLITGAGAGGGPHVRVFDGVSGQVIRNFFAFESTFTGGISVAAGDVNGNGIADFVIGAGAGGGPAVAVINGKNLADVRRFFAYDPTFTGGVNVAVGHVTGRPEAEIIVGAGPGGGPHVQIFNGVNLATVSSFFAVPPSETETSGVFVGLMDFNRDTRPEIVAVPQSPSPNQPARIRTFDLSTGSLSRPVGVDLNLIDIFNGAVFVGGITS